ncbi:hypothetical protein NBRGN_057_02880 [Nocardia brasiliensis NBRC 14402]|uniref:JmjC domain-containing protein n=1 Tax=Nocardia brasiliensis TaxID=37326 RepID=UPI0002DF6A0D|nr:cupin domain-containing protein [Nocardia brasiliensis]ASF11677.1 hypothetical protein CEQ30_34935 [Nocardia brasiliensis]GAJ82781.1 hypothetical protein NBRGN_057_02880 [Nocardia brasiliensis NBRC 14402]SUB09520.1 Cupin superfamily protein [Nocardia brasiliensis]
MTDTIDHGLATIVTDPDTFRSAHWQQERATGTIADPRTATVLTTRDIEQILLCSAVRFPYIKLSRTGTTIPVGSYIRSRDAGTTPVPGFIDPARTAELYRQGATIVLNRLEEWYPPVARLCHQVSQSFDATYVEAGAFLSPPGAQALPLHRDCQDLLILQLEGTKSWETEQRTPAGAWTEGAADSLAQPLHPHTLRAGEFLYLPRGAAHRASAGTDHHSLHLTLGVNRLDTVSVKRHFDLVIDRALTEIGLPSSDDDDATLLARLAQRMASRTADSRPHTLRANIDPDQALLTVSDWRTTA